MDYDNRNYTLNATSPGPVNPYPLRWWWTPRPPWWIRQGRQGIKKLGAAPPPAKEDPENDPYITPDPIPEIPLTEPSPMLTMPSYPYGTKEYKAEILRREEEAKAALEWWNATRTYKPPSNVSLPIPGKYTTQPQPPSSEKNEEDKKEDQTVTDENRTALYITGAALLLLLMLGRKKKRK